MAYQGIDYGRGQTNIDHKTGIRYGVISIHEVTQAWCDSSEPFYLVHCPACGQELKKGFYAKRCPSCYKVFGDGDFDYIEPSSYYIKSDGYVAEQGNDDPDIFIIKSPYYTLCRFCSPCAPGAGDLMRHAPDGIKAYCFGHDWFDSGRAPYPVYSVKTGKLVEPKK